MKKNLLLFILQIMGAGLASAQLLTVGSGTTLTISLGTDVSIKNGDFLNQPGGMTDNNGSLHLTNDWINNGGNTALVINKGTVDLNGANAQTIKGTTTTEFNNLTISNGTGFVTLNVNTDVGGTNGLLNLGARAMQLNSKILLITNSSNGAITRTTGYIKSETPPASGYGIIGWTVNTNTGSFVFPFGTGSNYIPFTYNITTSGTGNGILSLATYPTLTSNAPNNRPLPTGVLNVNDTMSVEDATRVIDRFWPLSVSGYSALPLATMIFTYQDNEWDVTSSSTNIIAEGNLKAQRWNGFSWIRPPSGTTNITSNTTTVTAVDSFNTVWTLVDVNYPLPVTLIDFNATLENNQRTKLSWQTANELQNDGFEIWRSKDGNDFSLLASVKSKAINGTSNNKIDYLLYDEDPYDDITYYKLKMMDQKGNVRFSELKMVKRNHSGNIFTVSPNPSNNVLNFFLNVNIQGMMTYTLIDANGKIVASDSGFLNKGENIFTENISRLSEGIYYLEAHSGETIYKPIKLVVIHP